MPTQAIHPNPIDSAVDDAPERPRSKWPAPDDQILAGGTRHELLDGSLIVVPPAKPDHADRHYQLAVLQAHLADGYKATCDMLTRVSDDSDIAPDAAVLREGVDPETGGRYLEELAFEVVSAQPMSDMRRRAELLSTRGVRGIFAIDVRRNRVQRWDSATGGFVTLDPEAALLRIGGMDCRGGRCRVVEP